MCGEEGPKHCMHAEDTTDRVVQGGEGNLCLEEDLCICIRWSGSTLLDKINFPIDALGNLNIGVCEVECNAK